MGSPDGGVSRLPLKAQQRVIAEAMARGREQQVAEASLMREHGIWWERQAEAVWAVLRALPHPSVQFGSKDHFEHQLKALIVALFKRAAQWGAPLEDIIRQGTMVYEATAKSVAKAVELQSAQDAAVAEEIAAAAKIAGVAAEEVPSAP